MVPLLSGPVPPAILNTENPLRFMAEKIKIKHPNFRVLEGALHHHARVHLFVPCVQWVGVRFTLHPATSLQIVRDKAWVETHAYLLYVLFVFTGKYSNIRIR